MNTPAATEDMMSEMPAARFVADRLDDLPQDEAMMTAIVLLGMG